MKNNLILLCIFILFAMNLYSMKCLKNQENMTNTNSVNEKTISELIKKVYKTDIEAIRNLSDIADKLQGKGKYKNKEIVLPGNLTIQGNLKINKDLSVDKNSNVKGQTTINQLYGGIKGLDGWRTIKVNGNHLSFDVGANKYGFHSNKNGIYYARSNKYNKLPIHNGVVLQNLYVNDKIDTRRMDVRNDKGKMRTHFNYAHRGDNYIRGNLYQQQGVIKGKNSRGKWVNVLKKGDRVYLRSYGGWRSKTGKHKNKHNGIHFNSRGYAVAWYGGNKFGLE